MSCHPPSHKSQIPPPTKFHDLIRDISIKKLHCSEFLLSQRIQTTGRSRGSQSTLSKLHIEMFRSSQKLSHFARQVAPLQRSALIQRSRIHPPSITHLSVSTSRNESSQPNSKINRESEKRNAQQKLEVNPNRITSQSSTGEGFEFPLKTGQGNSEPSMGKELKHDLVSS